MEKKKHFIIFLFALIAVSLSIFLYQKDSGRGEKEVRFGYPFGFVEQKFNDSDPINYYQPFTFKRDVFQDKFLWDGFLLSLTAVFLFLETLIYVLEVIDFGARKAILKISARVKK